MIETDNLSGDLKISRIINGMWQVAGGHGYIDPSKAVSEMQQYHDSGLNTWDMADIYGPAEEFFGNFHKKFKSNDELIGLTKFVPNPGPMNKNFVNRAIKNSILRMDVPSLDLVQFHWWDYEDLSYLDALEHLTSLRDEGKIRHIGLTNFDTKRMEIILEKGYQIGRAHV